MDIYFFSSHDPDPEMIQALGSSIKSRFRGCISDIHARDNQISFTETRHIGGETCEVCHTIPTNSIIVAEAPLAIQAAWLKAGVETLLIPQVKQKAGGWGHHTFKYDGLTQVHKIEITTSPWYRRESKSINNDPIQNREHPQPADTTSFAQALNPFRRPHWKAATPSISH